MEPAFVVKVKVVAGAKKRSIVENTKGLTISVQEPAQKNRANVEVLALVAEKYGVPKNKVRISKGHSTPSKIISIFS